MTIHTGLDVAHGRVAGARIVKDTFACDGRVDVLALRASAKRLFFVRFCKGQLAPDVLEPWSFTTSGRAARAFLATTRAVAKCRLARMSRTA